MSHPKCAYRHVWLPVAAAVAKIMPHLVLIVPVALVLTVGPTHQARAGLTALVPAYFYPGRINPDLLDAVGPVRPDDQPGRHRQSE